MKKIATLTAMGGAGLVLVVLMLAFVWGVGGWVLMLLLGAIHHSVWAAVPALGYWQAVLVYALLSLVGGLFQGAPK